MNRRHLVLAAVLLCCAFSQAAEYEVPWGKMRELAAKYLDSCVDPKEVAKRHKKFRSVVEQRLSESDSANEDGVMRSLMIDWAAGAKNRLKKKERDATIQACYYFVTFYDKGYDIPQLIRAEMTESVVAEIFEFLEAEIAKGGK